MRKLRMFKVIVYPMAAVLQFFVVPQILIAAVLALALLGLALLNLHNLVKEPQ